MKVDNCRLCLEVKELCDSHALPMAQFRPILKESAGKVIVNQADNTTPISYSSDTWSSYSLCKDCEEKLNEEYDKFGISFFQGRTCEVVRNENLMIFKNVDQKRLRMFILSVLWRMAVSEHSSYAKVILPNSILEELRCSLYENSAYNFPKSFLHVRLERLNDSTPIGTIDLAGFRSFILSPFPRLYKKNYYSICFLLFGFFVEISVPSIPLGKRSLSGILKNTNGDLTVSFVQFSEIPEIMDIAVNMKKKEIEGLSSIKYV